MSTLKSLAPLFRRYPEQFSADYGKYQAEFAKVIDNTDPNRSALALKCATIIIQANSALPANKQVVESSVKLSYSGNIEGHRVVDDLALYVSKACSLGVADAKIVDKLIEGSSLKARSAAKIAAAIIAANAQLTQKRVSTAAANI